MAAFEAGERTEEATPKRRRDARRRGTVAKSADLSNALVSLGLVIVVPVAFAMMGSGFIKGFGNAMGGIELEGSASSLASAFIAATTPALPGLAVLIACAMGVGLLSNVAQVGLVFSPQAMAPSLAKLNPLAGLKRMFSSSGAVEGAKAVAKSILFSWLVWASITSHWSELGSLAGVTPLAALAAVGSLIRTIALKIGVAWLALAIIDYFFQRKNVDKQLRMTKQEVRQEMKEAETSPELKAARAQRMRKLSKTRMMDAVRTADVIVTNPTHFAVALRYDSAKDHAPIVVAKGQDFLAAKIREAAKEAKVPLVPNPPLARALYRRCEVGDAVPRELFQAVAEVLAYVYKTLQKLKKSA